MSNIDYSSIEDLKVYVSGLRHLHDIPAWQQLMRGLENELKVVIDRLGSTNDPHEVMALKGEMSAYRKMTTWRERTVNTIDTLITQMEKRNGR